jgi:hypothetical protein
MTQENIRRLTQEELDFLANQEGVKRDVVYGVFSEETNYNSYDESIALALLDGSLFRWNPETMNVIQKGFNCIFKGQKIKMEKRK